MIYIGLKGGYDSDGSYYRKTYFIPKVFKSDWMLGKIICKNFNLDSASFETLSESSEFLTLCKNSQTISSLKFNWFALDAMTLSAGTKNNWYWLKSGRKITYTLNWMPYQPDYHQNQERCLSIGKYIDGNYLYNDIACQQSEYLAGNWIIYPVCQRIDSFISSHQFIML